MAGNDMLVVLSAIQLISGLCKPILEDVTTRLPHLGDGWFKLHRERLAAMSGIVWVERQWAPSLQRLHDGALMAAFVEIPGATTATIVKASWCRLYVRVITIADLAHENGRLIPG